MKKVLKLSLIAFIVLLALTLSSCTKANYDAFFAQVGEQVSLEEVHYRLAVPRTDTVIQWYAPYKVFENRTEFRRDSIYHQERFNWQGLGDFLWEQYQDYKQKRGRRKQEQSFNFDNDNKNTSSMKNLYTSIAQRLKEYADIEFIDLDVGQFEALEDYQPISLPAVFVSFDTIWTTKAKGIQHGAVDVGLLVVSDMILDTHEGGLEQEQALQHFDTVQKVYEVLQGYSAECFTPLERTGSENVALNGHLASTRLAFAALYDDRSILGKMEQSKVPHELALRK